MTTISTDLRQTRETARRIRFEPVLPFTATNVQDAIVQISTTPMPIVVTPITFASSPYTPTNSDSIIEVNTTGGAVTINLQPGAARLGLPLVIKDIAGQSGVVGKAISVVPNGVETVDSLAPYPIDSAYLAVQFLPKTAGGYFVGP